MIRIKPFLNLLFLSKLSILGAIIVTTAVGADVMLIVGELLIFESNPYIGIVAYILFPGIAIIGLLLIPLGILLTIRKSHRADPVGVLVRHMSRNKILRLIFALTMMNFVIFAFVGYRSFHYMESPVFCGLVCHQVMEPEYNTYLRSPHSEIACVDCHIGTGAKHLIKSKLDGTRQLASVLLNDYSRPIETPIHNLRPASEVCEVCHRSAGIKGNRIKVLERFETDEFNTRTYTILNLRVGGGGEPGRKSHGIHWHMGADHEIRYYASDEKREKIVRVELIPDDGEMRTWIRVGFEELQNDFDPESARLMDCVDCHNRPGHIYLSPDQALNNSMAGGLIDASIPWIRNIAEEVIMREYDSRESATEGIANLPNLYRERYPGHWDSFENAVRGVVPVLQEIHETYVYPEMKISWNTYPSLLGHPTAHTAACFRCHDGLLLDDTGSQITTDCTACHYVLADEERDPVILRMLNNQ